MKKIISMFAFIFLSAAAFSQTINTKFPEGLKVGDKAPSILAVNQNGEKVVLDELLKTGPVVVMFYRGEWCPYCNKQLKEVSDSLQFIQAKGATVIGVSPETAENVKKTVEKVKANFSVVHDEGMEIMKAYNVNYMVDNTTIEKYKQYGIDFEKANGNNGANLPVPATYVVGKEGLIKYVFFNVDYSKRVSVKELLDNL